MEGARLQAEGGRKWEELGEAGGQGFAGVLAEGAGGRGKEEGQGDQEVSGEASASV